MKEVCVIDDNLDTLTLVQYILESEGYEVQCFAKWQDFYHHLDIFTPSLILLDVYLGAADGRYIAKNLKSSLLTKHIPIILFSSNRELNNCDADDFMSKPLNAHSLINIVKKFIGAAVI